MTVSSQLHVHANTRAHAHTITHTYTYVIHAQMYNGKEERGMK